MSKDEQRDKPRVGDLAWHRYNELDPREVARIEEDQIWLRMHRGPEGVIGPFLAENYYYTDYKVSDL